MGHKRSYTNCQFDGNIKWYNHFGKQFGNSFKLIHLPQDPAIPILAVYQEK